MPQLTEISHFLNGCLQVDQYPTEQHGLWKPSAVPVKCIGLVLEPWPHIYEWIKASHLDALFIHRPWKLEPENIPAATGVLSYHLPFDEKLTLGYNPLLAEQLGMREIEPMGQKEGRPLGMTGNISSTTLGSFSENIKSLFGYPEQIHAGKMSEISRVAIMGAMTESLVMEAFQKGVDLYLTGQFRKPAARVVDQTGIHVIATGHRQSEVYGLHLLAKLLTDQWPDLQVKFAPDLCHKYAHP